MYYCMHGAAKCATALVVSSDKSRGCKLQCAWVCELVTVLHQGASVVCRSPARPASDVSAKQTSITEHIKSITYRC